MITKKQTPQAKIYYEDVTPGDTLPEQRSAPLTLNGSVRYSGASGDFNPLHTEPAFGQKLGLDGAIVHGMQVMGLIGKLISDYLGGSAPLHRYGVRFQSMTKHGTVIICRGKILNKYEQEGQGYIEAEVYAEDESGDRKATGTFIAELPRRI
jgi:acyl dehydratase